MNLVTWEEEKESKPIFFSWEWIKTASESQVESIIAYYKFTFLCIIVKLYLYFIILILLFLTNLIFGRQVLFYMWILHILQVWMADRK